MLQEAKVSTHTSNPLSQSVPQYGHSFDEATRVERLDSAPESLASVASTKLKDTTVWYRLAIQSEWCSTPQVPHGGFLASLLLSALLEHQQSQQHPDPYTLSYDFLKVLSPGEAFISVTSLGKVSGSFTSIAAELYQSRKEKVLLGVSVRGSFVNLSKQQGKSVLPLHYGAVSKLEEVPVPHPRSWYLPPSQAMISRQLDLLVKLETQRRPFSDYFVRFHPDDVDTPQQEDYSEEHASADLQSSPHYCKGSRILPLRSSHSRRIDAKSIPMFGDFRRPAYENVIKQDPCHPHDVPTRKFAFPTLQYTIRFLAKVPHDTEWLHTQWRETVVDGRIISDVYITTEQGAEPVAICQLDSLMFDMQWALSTMPSAEKSKKSPEASQL
ncbi:uncharacterized protein UMAG_06465 [Mycosarcoma maydis]|uniref:Ustilagic acid biosynthesis cluster protein orf2 n=1 Tax=Mycosarcoma maydis TaxID=5270 RepID=ORF2_MYCMD|nr:uncharacterized protein UMAG_06465 [Ustilago maydis 521]A0A0D1DNX6.1 RecName: Full=Ustilagic acid biosynthesis cluster protein orf2 [Ustilago maydis 521]KIS65761.1 hypothetical protein UMAG_06465 [Ustilago maydis 521]|eukprot:XP_011392732.1 hypothetical protein UMAG_06465 [Ustilago maydis 521]